MKRLYIPVLATALLGFTAVAVADAAPGRDGRADALHRDHDRGDPRRQLRHLKRVLDLTELQQQSIENAVLAARPELDALRTASRDNRRALKNLDVGSDDYAGRLAGLADEQGRLTRRKLQLQGELRAAIDAELTDAQRATLADARQQRKSRHGSKRRHRHEAAGSDTC